MSFTRTNEVEQRIAALRKNYLAALPEKITHIIALWELARSSNGDKETLQAFQHAAHTLAGSGATFGATAVSNIARKIDALSSMLLEQERQPDSGESEKISQLITKLHSESRGKLAGLDDLVLPQYQHISPDDKLIFIVEDDVLLAENLATILESEKYLVRVFDSLVTFKEAYRQTRPEAIIMDMSFPESSEGGAEVMQEVRSLQHPVPPLIFMSIRNDMTARLAAVYAGASRYFTKPLNTEKLLQTLGGLTHQIPQAAYRVMIVDDDAELAEYYAALLHGAGMDTKIMTNPLAVLDALSDWQPDLMMMDVYMPGCSGLELAAVIRQDDNFTSMPIVFLSAETDMDKQLYALDLGGDAFLTKPVIQQHLLSTIIARVKRSRGLSSLKNELEDALEKNKIQREEIEKKEERLRFSQYFANIGSWDLQLQNKAMHWSEKIAPLLGYKPDNITASYEAFLAAIHPDDKQKVISAIDACANQGTAYELEHRVIWADGSVHWLMQKGDVIRDESGQSIRMLGVVQDTTRRKQLERDLATQKEFAVQANNAKSEFLSRMSHELRTPLNAIIGFAQLLESDAQQPLHDQQQDSLDEILKAGTHLLELIDEVLDLAKIEAGKVQLHIEEMPVIDVLLESYSMMIPMAESNHIQLDFHIEQCDDIIVSTDRTK